MFPHKPSLSGFVPEQTHVPGCALACAKPLPSISHSFMTVKAAHVCRNAVVYVSVEQMLIIEDVILNLLNVAGFDPGMTCDCGNIVRRCPDCGIGIICRTCESSGSRLAQSTICGKGGAPKITTLRRSSRASHRSQQQAEQEHQQP
ncbi:MAG: hypothetical protein QE570_01510 [Verrucomicrobiota bacterium]|jgi:hypothetical protein|nr:hypothetical protein [Verrucomicrobiota bacterium]